MSRRPPSRARLRELLALWQGRLGLRDWELQAAVGRAEELGGGRSPRLGQVRIAAGKRRASILVLHPRDVPPECLVRQDPEISLVHELVEILLDPLTDNLPPAVEIAKEQAVEALSQALVALRRRPPPESPAAGPQLAQGAPAGPGPARPPRRRARPGQGPRKAQGSEA